MPESKQEKEEEKARMQMVVNVEEEVGRLYQAYSRAIPEHEAFWVGLTIEQGDRASAVLDLVRKVGKGKASFTPNHLRLSEAEKILPLLNEKITNAEKGSVTLKDAVETALGIEKTLSQQKLYLMFGDGSDSVLNTLEYLEQSSDDHVNTLNRELRSHFGGE